MFGRYQIWRSDTDGLWYWHLRAANGEVICASQGYQDLASARKGIRSVRLNAPLSRVTIGSSA